MVVGAEGREKRGGRLLLTGTEFQLNKMKRVVGMHGGDGSITM